MISKEYIEAFGYGYAFGMGYLYGKRLAERELANSYAKERGWDRADYYCDWQGKSVFELIDANRKDTDIVGYPSYIFVENGIISPVTPKDRQEIYDYFADLAEGEESES